MPDSDAQSDEELAAIWQGHRAYLVDLAFRIVGNIQDAEDAVQEAFARLLRIDVDEIDDIRGWLAVVVSRLCLDTLRSARVRREAAVATMDDKPAASRRPDQDDPADRVSLDDSVRMASWSCSTA